MNVLTKKELKDIFKKVGIKTGMKVMVHSSLSKLGYLVNGAEDIIDALLEIISLKKGTLFIPTHSGQLTNPIYWKIGGFNAKEKKKIKKNINFFNAKKTIPANRGLISRVILSYKGVKRSSHPLNSTACIGKKSKYYTSNHNLHSPEGYQSPIGKLYKDNGHILLIGVNFDKITALHLAEAIVNNKIPKKYKPEVLVNNKSKRTFIRLKQYDTRPKNFKKIYSIVKKKGIIRELKIKNCNITLIELKPLVKEAINKIKINKDYFIYKN